MVPKLFRSLTIENSQEINPNYHCFQDFADKFFPLNILPGFTQPSARQPTDSRELTASIWKFFSSGIHADHRAPLRDRTNLLRDFIARQAQLQPCKDSAHPLRRSSPPTLRSPGSRSWQRFCREECRAATLRNWHGPAAGNARWDRAPREPGNTRPSRTENLRPRSGRQRWNRSGRRECEAILPIRKPGHTEKIHSN